MARKISRRDPFKGVGVTGAATLLGACAVTAEGAQQQNQQSSLQRALALPSKELLAEHENYQLQLTAGQMIVKFDRRYGSISSITRRGDEFGTNYIGNETNTPNVDPSDSRWTGDVVPTVWALLRDWKQFHLGQNDIFKTSGKWKKELTGKSADIRRVSFQNNAFHVTYDGEANDDEGIRSYRLNSVYHAAEDSSLLWDIEIENVTGNDLEIGELGLPLMVNDDYAELYFDPGLQEALSTGLGSW